MNPPVLSHCLAGCNHFRVAMGQRHDPHPLAAGRSRTPRRTLPLHRRPQAPGPPPDRPDGTPRPGPPGHRRRPGVHRKTVTRWLNAYCDGGLDALRPRKAKGKPGNIPASLADELRRWVIDGPAQQGLDRANWTHAELADHLRKARGVQTSRSAVQRLCARIGVRLYRPTYRYLRGDPVKQARAKEDLAELGKGRRPASSSC